MRLASSFQPRLGKCLGSALLVLLVCFSRSHRKVASTSAPFTKRQGGIRPSSTIHKRVRHNITLTCQHDGCEGVSCSGTYWITIGWETDLRGATKCCGQFIVCDEAH